MRQFFIEEISIEGFRGINNEGDPLRLKLRRDAVNSVFARNAQGKSSIFEALSFAIRGVVPKLEDAHASESAGQYYANRFHSKGLAEITLTLVSEPDENRVEIRVRRDRAGNRVVDSPTGTSDPEAILKSLDSEITLVDHHTFQRFVEDSPLERGRTFSGLLGLGFYSEVRQVLEVLASKRTLSADVGQPALETELRMIMESRSTDEQTVRAAHRHLTGTDVEEPIDISAAGLAAVSALCGVDLIAPFLQGKDFREISWDEIKRAIRSEEHGQQQSHLLKLRQRIEDLGRLEPVAEEVEEVEVLRRLVSERSEALRNTRGTGFKTLYEVMDQLLQSEEWKDPQICPGCDSRLEAPLTDRVRERLAEFSIVNELSTKVSAEWREGKWRKRLQETSSQIDVTVVPGVAEVLELVGKKASAGEVELGDLDALAEVDRRLEEARKEAIRIAEKERAEVEKLLPPSLVSLTEQVAHGEKLGSALKRIENAEARAKDLKARLDARQSWADFVEEATRQFAEAEVKNSTARTLALEPIYRATYAAITRHPEIVPALRKVSGKEDLRLVLENFFGLENVSAGALLSESYRNALAISIFLGAAVEARGRAGFIILDDITSSFDAGHQFNVMEVIRTKLARPVVAKGAQVVILSHDGVIEKYFDRLSDGGGWNHQRIQGTPPRGTVYLQADGPDRLRKQAESFLNAGQIDPAEPLIRQYLEYKLQQVIRNVDIAVPFDLAARDDRKMVQNLLNAITKSVDLHRAGGKLVLSGSQSDELEKALVPAIVANWVSHYETGGTKIFTPYMLLGVLDDVDKLADCFTYECRCSGGVQRRQYRDLSSRRCKC